MNKAIECLTKNYSNFSGRASRSEYWLFLLMLLLMFLLWGVFLGILIGVSGTSNGNDYFKYIITAVHNILGLALIVPSIAVSVRRLHDIDKSGWWYLIKLIPIIGDIWLLVLYCIKGVEGQNKFGSDPLQA